MVYPKIRVMKSKQLLTLAAFIAITGGTVYIFAQSGREKPSAATKSNQRPAAPSPSLSPTPLAELEPENSGDSDEGEIVKVDTQLVTIPVRVMNKNGRFVGGLGKGNFKVFDE